MKAAWNIRRGKYLHRSYWLSLGWSLVRGVLIIGLSFIILYPIIIKISSSLMTERDLFDLTTKWLPRKLDLGSLTRNYRDLWIEMQYPKAFLNTFSLALLVAVLQLVSTTTVGYGFARFPYFGSNFMFAMVIFTLLVPPQMVMIPLFLNFRFFDCLALYSNLNVPVIGLHIPEPEQPVKIRSVLEKYNPDILVITGHDGLLRKNSNRDFLINYRAADIIVIG
jgi:ABC-type glycerol-3-phosphate transport system permease component